MSPESASHDLRDRTDGPIELPPPEPVPDRATYERERERALAFSDERRRNHERFQRSSRRVLDPDYLPTRLDVENVSRCNLRCTMCPVSEWTDGQRAQDLDLASFKSLIDEQYGLLEVEIQGLGEPTMQGDELFEMISYARAQSIWVRIVTNATLLHLDDGYIKLIDSGVNEVRVSIDGATQDVFEGIRKGSDFERVVSNCRLLNGYCEELGIQRTEMWAVVQRANVHQAHDLVRLAGDTGFRSLVFSLDLIGFGIDRWRERNDAASAERLFGTREARECMALGDGLGLRVRFSRQPKYDLGRPQGRCPWPFERAYVASDQRVVPCRILGNPDLVELGGSSDFSASWNGEAWQAFRRDHLSGRVPDVCRSCYRS